MAEVSGYLFGSPALPTQDFDPAQSFAYTSACSAAATSVLEASAVSYGYPIKNGVPTREMMERGLSDIGRTSDGTMITFHSLDLSGRGLTDITLLESFPHLRKLNLASNNLTDLSALSSLPYLTQLDVSYNKLSTILDFQPPKNLREANYSHNEIEEMCDLSLHFSLSKLNLDGNQIREVAGLCGLPCLSHLSLADNRLDRISELQGLPIKYLNLSGNSIRVIENLNTLTRLQVLDLSANQVSSLRGLGNHPCLMELNLEENEVVDLREVGHLKHLPLLHCLHLSRNPVEALAEYRPTVLFQLSSLTMLDRQRVTVEEKVSAVNRFRPPPEVVAAEDHRTNTTCAVHKPARLRFSTLTRLDEPYPMLVLCGPPGAGKGHFTKLLVDEFPSFFGLGVSHTTRPQRPREGHGRDYYFIDGSTFQRAAKSGEFIQTHCQRNGYCYGLTMAAVEQVAQQGLACVTHMSIEGVLSLKKTHFEPRYILTLPLTPQIHEQRMKAMGCYSDDVEIREAVQAVHSYRRLHQEKPGFFDTAINTDSLRDGYVQLRALVMAYGDITPESPLSLTSGSQQTIPQTNTSATTSEQTTPQPTDQTLTTTNSRTQTPSLLDPSTVAAQTEGTSQTSEPNTAGQVSAKVMRHMHKVAHSWSHPASHSLPGSRPVSGSASSRQGWRKNGSRTPASEQGSRRHREIMAAVAGKDSLPYTGSTPSTSRPGTRLSKSGDLPSERFPTPTPQPGPNPNFPVDPQEKAWAGLPELEEDSSAESSDETEDSASGSSLSKLSSARGFSPRTPSPLNIWTNQSTMIDLHNV